MIRDCYQSKVVLRRIGTKENNTGSATLYSGMTKAFLYGAVLIYRRRTKQSKNETSEAKTKDIITVVVLKESCGNLRWKKKIPPKPDEILSSYAFEITKLTGVCDLQHFLNETAKANIAILNAFNCMGIVASSAKRAIAKTKKLTYTL